MLSRKNGADAHANKAAQLFVVCEGNPDPTGRTVTTAVLALISPEESNDGTLALSLPSPLKKTRKTSHQRQIDRQNGRKGKDTYALALSRVTMLVAAERNEEKENARPTATVFAQVEWEFKALGFAVSLAKSTVNCYIQNDMVGSVPPVRGYEGIIPKAQSNLQTARPCCRIIHTDKAGQL
jgi:hypothetical protein